SHLVGVRQRGTLLRTLGVRELVSGLGILSQRGHLAGWVWMRVAGDVLDLALLGVAMRDRDARRGRVAAATLAVAGIALLDVFCARKLSRNLEQTIPRALKGFDNASMMVNRSTADCFRFWHTFQGRVEVMS